MASQGQFQPSDKPTTTQSPPSFTPRIRFGIAKSVRPFLLRHTLVFHVCPSTVARTGVRPQAWVIGGACLAGTGANTHPPFPGTRNSFALNRTVRGVGTVGLVEERAIVGKGVPNGWRSAAVDPIRSRRGHERSECLGAFHSSTASSNAR
jgi:hypothetical protein